MRPEPAARAVLMKKAAATQTYDGFVCVASAFSVSTNGRLRRPPVARIAVRLCASVFVVVFVSASSAVSAVLSSLEAEPNLQLQVAQRLRAGGSAEAGGPRRQTVRIERAVRQGLRVGDRQIRRAPIDHVVLPVVVDDCIEHVEDVEA